MNNYEFRLAVTYDQMLKDSNIPFSVKDVMDFINKHTGVRFGIGAEAIRELLKRAWSWKRHNQIKDEIQSSQNAYDQKTRQLLRRLECVRWIKDSGCKPEWMILTRIPVTPSETRPIISLDGGRFHNFRHKTLFIVKLSFETNVWS